MDTIETRIKQIIVDVAELPDQPSDLDDGSTLEDIGYNDNMCRDLEARLNNFIKDERHCNQLLNNGDISAGNAIGDIVKMVKDKLAKC